MTEKEIVKHLQEMTDKKEFEAARAAKNLYNRLHTASLIAKDVFDADARPDVVFHVHNLLAEHEALEAMKAQTAPLRGGDAA